MKLERTKTDDRIIWHGVCAAAAAFGVSKSHLSRVLSGERKPGAALARKLRRIGVETISDNHLGRNATGLRRPPRSTNGQAG